MKEVLERPSPAERPPIDPRIARRWIDARRAEGRRRLHLLLAAVALAACLALAAGSLFTPLFRVRHVRITVAGPLSPQTVARLAGVTTRTLTIHVNAAAIAARLDADPVLGAARVARHWPGTVTISVAVRTPIAVIALPAGGSGSSSTAPSGSASSGSASSGSASSGWAELDATGRVLADVASAPTGMPVFQGPAKVPAPGGWLAGSAGPAAVPGAPPSGLVDMNAASDGARVPAGPAAALAFLDALPAALRADVPSITAGPGGMTLVLNPPVPATGSVTVLLGDGSQLQSKVTALETIVDQGDLSGVAGLDLTVPSRPSTATSLADLSPAPPSATPSSATPSSATPSSATPASGTSSSPAASPAGAPASPAQGTSGATPTAGGAG